MYPGPRGLSRRKPPRYCGSRLYTAHARRKFRNPSLFAFPFFLVRRAARPCPQGVIIGGPGNSLKLRAPRGYFLRVGAFLPIAFCFSTHVRFLYFWRICVNKCLDTRRNIVELILMVLEISVSNKGESDIILWIRNLVDKLDVLS